MIVGSPTEYEFCIGRCKVKCSQDNKCFPSLFTKCFGNDGFCLNAGGVNTICDKVTDSCMCDKKTGKCEQVLKNETVVDIFPAQVKNVIDIESALMGPSKMLPGSKKIPELESPCLEVDSKTKKVIEAPITTSASTKAELEAKAKAEKAILDAKQTALDDQKAAEAKMKAELEAREKAQKAALKTKQDLIDAQKAALERIQQIHNNIRTPIYVQPAWVKQNLGKRRRK